MFKIKKISLERKPQQFEEKPQHDEPKKRFKVFITIALIVLAGLSAKPVFSYFNPPLDIQTQITIKEKEAFILELEAMMGEVLKDIQILKNPVKGLKIIDNPFTGLPEDINPVKIDTEDVPDGGNLTPMMGICTRKTAIMVVVDCRLSAWLKAMPEPVIKTIWIV